MALEDVVQGVQVTVKTDGVDDAKTKIGQLDKAIGDLSKTAGSAAGGGGGGGGAGIGGLSKAFSDLNTVSAQSFANIARSAFSGDLTGLATMMGGPVAGSVVEAAKALGEFTIREDSAILRNAAMAKEFGTTPGVMQGLKEGFEGAGVSAGGFERLVNRMSRQVVNDYSSLMSSLRTDNATQEKATLRLQTAQENYQKSLGIPKEVFEAQDQLHAQKQTQIAIDDAVEAQRQTALKSIPHVTELLRESARAGKEDTDLMEVNVGTLRKSFEFMAGSRPGHIATGVDLLKQEADSIQSHAITQDTAYQLLSSQMGSRMSAGLGGMDTEQLIKYFEAHGSAGVEAAQAGKTMLQETGVAQTKEDEQKALETIKDWGQFTSAFGALLQKMGAGLSGHESMLDTIINAGKNIALGLASWHTHLNAAADAAASQPGDRGGLGGLWDKVMRWNNTLSAPLPTPETKPPGSPVSEEQPTTETIGSGPGKIIHVPGKPVPPPDTSVPVEDWERNPNILKRGGVTLPEHMSVLDPESAPWRSIREKDREGAAPVGFHMPSGSPLEIFDNIWQTAMSGLRGGPMPAGGVAPPGMILPGAAAPVVAPIPPAITVNTATPTINVGVVAPVSLSVSGGGGTTATATPGIGSATVPGGHADGGAIYIPGFADGGGYDYSGLMGGMSRDQMASDIEKHPDKLVRGFREYWNPISQAYEPQPFGDQSDGARGLPGFADGGSLGIPSQWPQDISKNPLSTQAMLGTAKEIIKEHGLNEAIKWFAEKGIKYSAEGLLLAAGITPQGRAIEIAAGAATNILEPTTVGAADWNAGARQEEEAGRARGAHNLKEANELPEDGMWGGGIPGFAAGSIRGPGNGTSDSILARLSNGEFVMKDAAVRTYGEGFMHAINNMQIPPPKYAGGGMIPASSLPHFSEGGAMERPGSILNLHVGGEVFSGLKAPAAVADQLRKFAIGQQTSQTGRKPSWAGG